jgi:nicotinate phosphoribosyltransferase
MRAALIEFGSLPEAETPPGVLAMNKPVESSSAEKLEYLKRRTDKYFTKSRQIIERFGDRAVTYGVFLHRGVICAVNPAIDVLRTYYPPKADPVKITRLYEEGAFVPDQKALFTYTGSFAALVELETLILQRVGVACVSAYNAYKMAMNLKKVAFIDMHARHSPGDDLSLLAAYGASIGSRMAKLGGATGFIGSSQDLTAHFYGQEKGVGTMPHAIVGYAGSTLRAAQMYVETHPKENLTVLIDYYGHEYSDSLEVCRWWYHEMLPKDENGARQLALRIDTHGERYAEGLDYEKSTEIVVNWLHVPNEYEAVRYVMGEEAFDADSLNIVKDRVRKVLFGTGVSVAAVIQLRQALDSNGFNACKIVGSSGFNLFKCKMFANARAPLDVVGTGSFIPDNFNDTFATADIFMYDGKAGIKLGREKLFQGLKA